MTLHSTVSTASALTQLAKPMKGSVCQPVAIIQMIRAESFDSRHIKPESFLPPFHEFASLELYFGFRKAEIQAISRLKYQTFNLFDF